MGIPKIDWANLSDTERLQLLDAAWESFQAARNTLPLTPAQSREIDRRQAAHEDGSMKGKRPTAPPLPAQHGVGLAAAGLRGA